MSNALQVIKSDPDSIAQAVAQIVEDGRPVSIPHREKADTLNDINALGYSLLSQALPEMSFGEIKFAASMCGAQTLSDKQRSWLKSLAYKYLGIDIDAGSVASSTAVAEPPTPKKKKSKSRKLALVRAA